MGSESPNVYDDWYTDPRTGLVFVNEEQAIASGYGKPVDVPGTIVMVGSQGSYTAGGEWVTSTDQLVAPGADNAGYVGLAAANMLNTPSSSAEYARDWATSYMANLKLTGLNLSTGTKAIAERAPITPQYTQLVEAWKNIPALSPSASVQYNTPNQSPGSTNEPPSSHMVGAGNTVGTVNTVGAWQKLSDAVTSYGFYILGALVLLGVIVFFGRDIANGVRA